MTALISNTQDPIAILEENSALRAKIVDLEKLLAEVKLTTDPQEPMTLRRSILQL